MQHTMSRPAYPRSNGQAERMVQTAKNLLRKCSQDNTDYQQGLLALRDTPISNNLPSPAELLQGRRLRGNLPIVTIALICRCVIRNCVRSRAASRYDILHSKHSAGMERSGDFLNIKLLENDVLLLDGI